MKTPHFLSRLLRKSLSLPFLLAFLFLSSCSPIVYYLGDNFNPTTNVDVYYATNDISKEYRTIGKLTHGKYARHSPEDLKSAMIKKAKESGADGILFTATELERQNDSTDGRLSVTADLIKYK